MMFRLPRGYQRLQGIAPLAVSHDRFVQSLHTILATGTLFDWAAAHPERREYRGRGPVYSAPLPNDGTRVVVRHARRGGWLAPILGDVYLPPTPAASELVIAAILARAGVPTPPMVGYATYRALGVLRRLDVVTVEVNGLDLAATLAREPEAAARPGIVHAVARLLAALLNAGAWHQDLNAKNILIATTDAGDRHGVLLDVDRVRFVPAGDPHMRRANLERLRRSMDKYRERGEPALNIAEFAEIEALVGSEEAARATDRETALEAYMPWE